MNWTDSCKFKTDPEIFSFIMLSTFTLCRFCYIRKASTGRLQILCMKAINPNLGVLKY
jgi:hypothetical protein